MKGINKVILVGNVGKDPEVKYLQSGEPVANFSIATSESWKDKQTGKNQERTEWHNIVAFKRLAEIVNQYVRKGSKLYIEGKIRTEEYQKDGSKRYITKIIAENIQMLDSKNEDKAAKSYKGEDGESGLVNGRIDVEFDDDVPF